MTVAAYRPYTAGSSARRRLAAAPPRSIQAYTGTGIPGSGPGSHGAVLPSPADYPPSNPQSPAGPYTPPGTTGTGTGTGGTPPAGGGDPYANDPIYQQIVGLANANVQQAEAAATAARKQVAIELGDPNLAHSLKLGSLVEQTAQANPFSTLKNLLRSHNSNVQQTNESLNKANLYSSSSRERGLQLEQTGYQGGIAGAAGSAQHALTAILASLLEARQNAAMTKAQAAADAYDKAKGDQPLPPEPKPTTTAAAAKAHTVKKPLAGGQGPHRVKKPLPTRRHH